MENNENEIQEVNVSNVQEVNQTPEVTESKGLSIASLVLGIVAVVLCCLWYVSIPCSILAIIFGVIGGKKGGKGMAKAGLILGIVSIALVVLFVGLIAAFVTEIMEEVLSY